MKKMFFRVILFFICTSTVMPLVGAEKGEGDVCQQKWEIKAGAKYFFASTTTYQFGSLDGSKAGNPLSKLEFPLNTLWMGGEVRRFYARYSMGIHGLTNVKESTHGYMKDSDWTNEANPDERTIFSTSLCRLNSSIILGGDFDLNISDWLKLPCWLRVCPLVGFEWQHFSMVAHDGVQHQYNPPEPDVFFPQDALRFRQDYWQYEIGVRTDWDIKHFCKLLPLKIKTEVHWAFVKGDNEDHHLLREGNRFTTEKTSGWSIYALTEFQMPLTKNIVLNSGVDFRMIRTTGTHRLYNKPFGIDYTWDNAVEVWSDQLGARLGVTYTF